MRKLRFKNKKNRKAQIWAIDLSIALIIFVGVIFLFYKYSISFAPEDPLINKMIKEGGYVSNTLLTTGFPPNWNELNLDETFAIGLTDKDGMLDLNKLSNFSAWIGNSGGDNYTASKKKVNTKYDYYITFYDGTSAPFEPIGLEPASDAKQIIKIQRFAAYEYDGNKINNTKMIIELWTRNNV